MVTLQQRLQDTELSVEKDSTNRTPYILIATGIDKSDAQSVGMNSERGEESENNDKR